MGGFCPRGFVQGDLSGGILSGGGFVQGDFVLGDFANVKERLDIASNFCPWIDSFKAYLIACKVYLDC